MLANIAKYVRELLQDSRTEVPHPLYAGGAGDLPGDGHGSDPGPGWSRPGRLFRPDVRKKDGAGLLGMYSMFTGGALERCAVGALGIMPYISATIILQPFDRRGAASVQLAREEGGRAKIIQYGRYLTVLLCLGQGLFMAVDGNTPATCSPVHRRFF